MQFDLENISSIYQKLSVEIPAENLEQDIENKILDYAKKVNLPGYRAGKAPLNIVRMRFYDAVRGEVIEKAVNDAVVQAATEKNINALSIAKLDMTQNEKDKVLKFEAKIEVMPEIDVADVKKCKIELFEAKVSDTDTENMLEEIRTKNAAFVEVDRAAKEGDQVNIDFEGFIDGVAFEGGKAEKYDLILGSKSFIDTFEDQLIGCKVGDEKTVKVSFPAEYQAEELAGKPAEFKIKVHAIKEKQLAELNEEFFKQAKVANLEELKVQIEKGLIANLDAALENQKRQQVVDAIIEINEVEVPPTALENEIGRLKNEQEQQYAQYFGSLPEGLNLPRELFVEKAEQNVKSAILITSYAKKDDIKVEEKDTEELLQKLLATYPNPKEMEQTFRANANVMQNLESMALETKVINTLAEAMKAKSVKKTFKEVVYPEPEQAENQ